MSNFINKKNKKKKEVHKLPANSNYKEEHRMKEAEDSQDQRNTQL